MQRDMVLRNLSEKTQVMYHAAARDLEKYFNKPPDQLNEGDVKSFLLSIVQVRKLSQSSLKINYSALRFLYETTLGKGWAMDRIPYPKTTKSIPRILTKSEIQKIFDATVTLKQKVMLMVTYSAGLRISETARLKITDIDSARMLIRVEQGKGNKDRHTLLSQVALETLRDYWKEYRPKNWLFPKDTSPEDHVPIDTIRQTFQTCEERSVHYEARELPHPSSQLRHPPFGGRRRSAHDSGPARPLIDQDDDGIPPRKQEKPRQGRKSPGSGPQALQPAPGFLVHLRAVICREYARPRTDRGCRHLPPVRASLPERPSHARKSSSRHAGDRDLPHR
jgi:site-specific recombinase XerD